MELSIERLISGEEQEFDRFVREHQSLVTRLVSRLMGWSDDSNDVIQDVFVDVLRGLKKFRQESSVETWLTRITINACRRHQRRAAIRRVGMSLLRHRHAREPATSDSEFDDETLASVRRGIRELPRKEREVIVLRYLEQVPIVDIAALLGISKNNTEVRLHRGREKLRHRLEHVTDTRA